MGYDEVVRIPNTAIGRDKRTVVEIKFSDGTYVVGKKKETRDNDFLRLSAEVSGPGSLAHNAYKLSQGEPLEREGRGEVDVKLNSPSNSHFSSS